MRVRIILLLAVLTLFVFNHHIAFCEPSVDKSGSYYLPLHSIGVPTLEKESYARNIIELKIFDGRLYIGHGDATVNTGPTDVIYYDLSSGEFVTEFTVDDEAIKRYRTVDGKLVIPGIDATEDWDFGNVYVREEDGWGKHRSIRHGLHVFDVVSYSGKWYSSTGCYFKLDEEEIFPFGGIFESEDKGETWKLVYSTPTNDNSIFRISSIIPFNDKLYCFNYAYTGFKPEDVPKDRRKYLGKTYYGEYYIFNDDLFGSQDCLTYDGSRWRYADIIDRSHICMITPFVFGEKLLMSVLSGEFVDYFNLRMTLPGNASMGLYAYDGEKTEAVGLEFDMIKDILVKGDELFLLLLRGGIFYIAGTKDLENWTYYYLPGSIDQPRSIEYDGKSIFIGADDGNIFKSIGIEKTTGPAEVNGREPWRIIVAGELPRNGRSSWAAITNWKKWGKLATLSCEIKDHNVIEIATENVSSFEVFVPAKEIDKSQSLSLLIDGKREFRGKIRDQASLSCELTKWEKWKVRKGKESASSFEYSRMFIGETGVELSRKGDDPPLGLWVSDVIRWSSSSDIALFTRGRLRKDLDIGEIALEELFDICYRTAVCTFRIKGNKLEELLNFNVKQPERDRCQISGFTMECNIYEDPAKNAILKSSLDEEKEYLVAAPEYLLKQSKFALNGELQYESGGALLTDAMIDWFEEFRRVERIAPRIKVTKKTADK